MPQTEYSQAQYEEDFLKKDGVREKALEHALDIRKFEIDLYWKRATYFWTFIGATFAGFVAVQALTTDAKQDMSVMLSCLGFVFSVAWVCVNRGSKHWQENWEKHVDMLETPTTGPLYKVVLTRREPKGWSECARHVITGPSQFSVSKINQIISLYVSILWGILVWHALPPFDLHANINQFYCALVAISLIACVTFWGLGRTYQGGFWHRASIRTTAINNK